MKQIVLCLFMLVWMLARVPSAEWEAISHDKQAEFMSTLAAHSGLVSYCAMDKRYGFAGMALWVFPKKNGDMTDINAMCVPRSRRA